MIDTHTHLYQPGFENDICEVIERAQAEGVTHALLPAIDAETHARMLQLSEQFPGYCLPMIGLHPCSVNADFNKEIELIKELLTTHMFYGIGETGLDFYWDKSFVKEQYAALHMQAELAIAHQLPLILHTRNATPETISVIREYAAKNLRGIFHCFGGTLQEAEEIVSLGFSLGIGGVVTYKNGGLQNVLPYIDLKHIVLETDAPYLTPVPHRGKRNETAYLRIICEKIAELKQLSVEEVDGITTQNAKAIFKI